MQRVGILRQMVLIAVIFSSACQSRAEAPPRSSAAGSEGIAWFHDLYAAHKVAKESGRPLLIVFGADWCHYCKQMEKTTLADGRIVSYVSTNFVPVHLDADRDQRVAKILKVKPIPCTVLLSPEADLLGKVVGFRNVSQYMAELEKSHARFVKVEQRRKAG